MRIKTIKRRLKQSADLKHEVKIRYKDYSRIGIVDELYSGSFRMNCYKGMGYNPYYVSIKSVRRAIRRRI